MKLRTITLALICAGFVTQPILGQAAPRATTVGLGTFGGTVSEANAINNSGQVVGSAFTSGNANKHAFF